MNPYGLHGGKGEEFSGSQQFITLLMPLFIQENPGLPKEPLERAVLSHSIEVRICFDKVQIRESTLNSFKQRPSGILRVFQKTHAAGKVV